MLDMTKALQRWVTLTHFRIQDMRDARGYLRRGKADWAVKHVWRGHGTNRPDPAKLTEQETETLDAMLEALIEGLEATNRIAQVTLDNLYRKQQEEA